MTHPHIVLTGASSGIGAALAWELSRTGARLTLVARRREKLQALAEELPGETLVLPRDLSDSDPSWLEQARAALGPIDVLVNNAGGSLYGRTADLSADEGERVLALNLHTPLRLTHAVLPELAERGGMIVNIASIAAFAPVPGMTWYNASKGGLAAASESLAGELLGSGIHVLTVYPGVIDDTAMGQRGLDAYESTWSVRLQPRASSAALAKQIRWAMEKRKARLVYPRANLLARWFPGPTRRLIDRLSPPISQAR